MPLLSGTLPTELSSGSSRQRLRNKRVAYDASPKRETRRLPFAITIGSPDTPALGCACFHTPHRASRMRRASG